ncbi:hypothetical protein RAH42_13145 (plasmid) [Pyramidobacter sp. YE332]|uniref:hypothetical protein n=1 Tax=Pyramidobacter sp. YE332 TaxID=3068894 RepID=UPI00294AC31A|nr:hypothetical protein [Pyramidobacter sp. YE332]WOL39612.1 hypothetical protein RAH42_10775 [Pyramidobacter sp. YE332]WOL41358.1 hypothetical protein RAH42_13145 [Pyramidobacter sp. YE332]
MTNEEYVRLQDMWLKATGVREGCWVKVLRAVKNHESGWGNSWAPEMDMLVGRTMQVKDVRSLQGIALGIDGDSSLFYFFPFFVLEPTEAPKKKYEFKPFEQVLVRDEDSEVWDANLFNYTRGDGGGPFECVSCAWHQCIPYAGHEHLLGTTDEPEDWAKYYDKACYDKE